jgi:nucleotide-binding universal stress UspA family protein
MINNVLVPVDGSVNSGKALTLGVDIAEKYNAKLSILFVASYEIDKELQHFTSLEYNPEDDSAVRTASEQIGKSTIKRMIEKLETNIAIKSVVIFGNAATRIVEYARNKKFDIVVMGTRGLSDIKGLLMGSVSRKVSKSIECTFVTIK